MAVIGDILISPENGFKRYHCSNPRFVCKGTWIRKNAEERHNENSCYSNSSDCSLEFKFYGTKLILLSSMFPSACIDCKVIIDGEEDIFSPYSENYSGDANTVVYISKTLDKALHIVRLLPGTDKADKLALNAIDIDEDGKLLTEEEYEAMRNRVLIKSDNKYYTIEDDNLVEITDAITSQLIIDRGVSPSTLTEKQSLLPDKFKLISRSDSTFNIKATKSHKELVVASSDFSTSIQSNIDFFDVVRTVDSGTSIKVAFSIDEGITWKTYDTNFKDLSITVPLKPYNELTEEELNQWNNARDIISEQGIDVANLSKIDFNSLSMDKIRFAYVFNIENANNNCKLNSTKMTYDENPPYRLMKDSEVDIDINEINKKIIITPHITTPEIKVNISSNGILSNDTVIDNLTEDQINKLKIKLGL